jgi:predicted Zn-dependent protease
MKKITVTIMALWAGCVVWGFSQTEQSGSPPPPASCSTAELKAKADAILSRPNVSVRGEIGVVFDLVDRLLNENAHQAAETYLVKGLKHYPWNLKYQMAHAELLVARGDRLAASEKARLVLEYAEEADLIEQATKMLGQEALPVIPDMSAIPGTKDCIVLVPLQGCAAWLLHRVQKDLSEQLALPVHIQKVEMRDPGPGRDRRGFMLNFARKKILENMADPEIKDALLQLHLTETDLQVENRLIKLLEYLTRKSGPGAVERFHAALADGIGKNPQWDAVELDASLMDAIRPYARKNTVYLGITPADIFTGQYNFLFAKGPVISYHRFTAAFTEEPPNQKRQITRTLTQCLATAADFYGLPRCTNPTCAHAYPNSLDEHDAKKASLCPACRGGFPKAQGVSGQ